MAKLYFYYSAMNAGKTTTLLQSSYNYRERGMNTIIFTPAIDNRYEVGYVTSRIGLSEAAVVFDPDFDFFDFCQNKLTQQSIQCIFIDEGHFLTKQQVKQLAHIADQLSIPVLAYGLRSDFQGETFEGSQYLLAWAEILSEIKTICYCGSKATMNMRIDEHGNKITEGNQVEIGGNERYISVCRKHFYNHNPSMINTAEEIEHDNCEH